MDIKDCTFTTELKASEKLSKDNLEKQFQVHKSSNTLISALEAEETVTIVTPEKKKGHEGQKNKTQKKKKGQTADEIRNKTKQSKVTEAMKSERESLDNLQKHPNYYKTLKELEAKTKNLSLEGILEAVALVFNSSTDEIFKQHLFIEAFDFTKGVLNDIKNGKHRTALLKYEKTFTPTKRLDFVFKNRMKYFIHSSLCKHPIVLDEEQKIVAKYMREETSFILAAPTSFGKTALVMLKLKMIKEMGEGKMGILAFPTQELANQAAGTARYLPHVNGKTDTFNIIYLNGDRVYVTGDRPIAIIGTAKDIEHYIITSNTQRQTIIQPDVDEHFDIIGTPEYEYYSKSRIKSPVKHEDIVAVIIDEVQQINDKEQGASMTKLLMMFPQAQHILLSATIGNIEHIRSWMCYIKGDYEKTSVKSLSYKNRFIAQAKYTMSGSGDGSLVTISPLGYLTSQEIRNGIMEHTNIQFPHSQLIGLSESLIKINPALKSTISPDVYFKERQINLKTCKEYEDVLKEQIKILAGTHDTQLDELFVNNHVPPILPDNIGAAELYKTLKYMKDNDMMNAIVFILDSIKCRDVAFELEEYMTQQEYYHYPLWYELREIQIKCYEAMNAALKKHSASKNKSGNEKNADRDAIMEQEANAVELIRNQHIESYVNQVEKLIQNNMNKWAKQKRFDLIDKYALIMEKIKKEPSLNDINAYTKHPDYTFMAVGKAASEQDSRNIKKLLVKACPHIDGYNSPIIKLFERGIFVATKYLNSYNEKFQELCHEVLNIGCQVVISDPTYVYGINLPLRTSVLLHPDYNKDEGLHDIPLTIVHQAAGRSGRRGFDTVGNVVFMGVNYQNDILGTYTDIIGTDPLEPHEFLPIHFNGNFCPSKLCKVPLSKYRDNMTKQELQLMEENIKETQINAYKEVVKKLNDQSPRIAYKLYTLNSNAHSILYALNILMFNHPTEYVDSIAVLSYLYFHEDVESENMFSNAITKYMDEMLDKMPEDFTHGINNSVPQLLNTKVIRDTELLPKVYEFTEFLRILFCIYHSDVIPEKYEKRYKGKVLTMQDLVIIQEVKYLNYIGKAYLDYNDMILTSVA
jgi:hypothetical protein